jgi:UTP-glucose-1-phosphate uridylyltransferase
MHKSMVAVSPSPVEREKREILRYYGIAVLKARRIAGHSSRVHELQGPLMEKPQEPRTFPPMSRKIAGRYILTPEIFDSVEMTGPELTAALNEHWKTLYAYELRKDLVALSPYQEIIDVISSIKPSA